MTIDLHLLPSWPQSQDSLKSQMVDLIQVANRLGFYDAATLLLQLSAPTPPPKLPTDEELDDFIMFWWGSNAEEQTITDAIECGLMAAFARDILPKLKQQ